MSGPLVVKNQLFGDQYRDEQAAGVEMEVVGVIKAVGAIHQFLPPGSPKPKIVLGKGISDYTGKKGEHSSCKLFGVDTEEAEDDALQVYATLQSCALVLRFVAGEINQI